MDFMSQILYINILDDWSLSGIMTSKLVIRESELPRPAASSILISRMTSSSVIIPYKISKPYTIYAPNMRALGENILAERRHKKTKEDHHIKLWYEYCI